MIRNKDSNGWMRLVKNKNIQAAFILIFFLIFFYRDVVFFGKTFLMETAAPGAGPYNYKGVRPGFVANDPGAIAWQIEPFNRFISTSLKRGDFPLWNPYAGLAGSPLLADGHTGPLEPLQFFFFFIPGRYWTYAVDIQLLLRFFLAGFFCYLFAQRQKIGFLGSISAGVLFMLSSYFVTYGNHPQIKTEALLPLVLYGYDRLANFEDRRGGWFCALFIGWAIVAAMPEATFFVLFLGTLWYFYKSIICWAGTGRNFTDARNIFLRYLGSTILGFLISTAYLLPFLEFVSLAKSVHSAGSGGNSFPLWAIPNLIFQVPGNFHLQLGFFALFSLFFSLLHLEDWLAEYRKSIIFFSLYAIIIILTIYNFPLTNWIRILPVFNQLVFTKYPVPSIVFCLAILAGILIDRIIYTPLSYKKLSLSLLAIFILFIGLPTLGNPFKSLYVYFPDNISAYAALKLVFSISAALFLLVYLYKRQEISARVIQIGLLFLVALEPFFWSDRINRPDRVDPFQTPPFVDYLREDKELFRIFGLDGILYPNISTAYQLSDIRWLNALIPQQTYDFSAHFLESNEVNSIRFTGTVLPVSDEIFNILNVKYILNKSSNINADACLLNIAPQPYFGKDTIHAVILEQNLDKKKSLLEAPLNINGITRTTILAQSPQEFSIKLKIPDASPTLDFSIGLNPDVFLPDRGDGVDFHITLLENKNTFDLFSKYIDPKNDPCERKWFDESLNLDRWAGKEVILSFSTNPGPIGDISWDWAYWGDIHLGIPSDANQTRTETTSSRHYNLVYQSQGVDIYQNKNVFPRAFVVYNIVNIPAFNKALDLLTDPDLDLRQTAVVENLPIELENLIRENNKKTQSVAGSAKLINSGELEVVVNTKSPGLLIVIDQYYPGWQAYVDGKQSPIYAVDGIFRGVFLEKGDHIIQFKYRPLSFIIGTIISSLSLLVTIMFLISKFKVLSKNMNNSPYYKDTGKIALASKISVQFREKMFARFIEKIKPEAKHKILDIGVTNDDRFQESNYFERLYPYKDRIVCVGTEDGSYLEKKYPGIKFIQITPGERLPFNDNEFDISFSNAVIEHVGSRESQKAFILEMLRVSRSFFLTTPNRWFPIELHTAIPFLHFLPKNIYRKLLVAFGETYWSKEENLNLLSSKELHSLFPKEVDVYIDSVRLLGISTNLIAFCTRKETK